LKLGKILREETLVELSILGQFFGFAPRHLAWGFVLFYNNKE